MDTRRPSWRRRFEDLADVSLDVTISSSVDPVFSVVLNPDHAGQILSNVLNRPCENNVEDPTEKTGMACQ
jgi:hypothetical protein